MCDDFFDDFGWEDLALATSLAESIADEEKERLRIERDMEKEDDESCCKDSDPFDPPDEDPFP